MLISIGHDNVGGLKTVEGENYRTNWVVRPKMNFGQLKFL